MKELERHTVPQPLQDLTEAAADEIGKVLDKANETLQQHGYFMWLQSRPDGRFDYGLIKLTSKKAN